MKTFIALSLTLGLLLCGMLPASSSPAVQAQDRIDWHQSIFAPPVPASPLPPPPVMAPAVPAASRIDWNQPLFSLSASSAAASADQPTAQSTQAKPATRIVYRWTRPNCPPCRQSENDEVADREMFAAIGVVFRDGAAAYPNIKPEQVPFFRWVDSGGTWRYSTGWTNSRDFISSFLRSDQKAQQEARASRSASYPTAPAVRAWDGPDETKAEIISHLLTAPNHRGKFTEVALQAMTLQQLRALHSDDHERAVRWDKIAAY